MLYYPWFTKSSLSFTDYRNEIQYGNISEPSLKKASIWFDTMTIYIDLLLEIQSNLAEEILRKLDDRTNSVTAGKTEEEETFLTFVPYYSTGTCFG